MQRPPEDRARPTPSVFHLIIVGGGPAGLAPLLAAHRTGDLDSLLAAGVAVIEQSATLGTGGIGGYAINSDSSGRTFVDCLTGPADTDLTKLSQHSLARQLAAAGDGAVALRDVGRFLGLVGETLAVMLRRRPSSAVFTGHRVLAARQTAEGWRVTVKNLATGEARTLLARHVVLATGAHQPADRLATERVGGVPLAARCGERLMQSNDVLAIGGLEEVARRLAGVAAPRVAIAGGSTSAAAVAHALLHRLPTVQFGAGGVTLLHRRPLRIFYPDAETALAEGYREWTETDICPISRRVYRLAGFRLESRELLMQARGIGGRPPEPRLTLHSLRPDDPDAARILDEAHVVVAALGYRPRALAVQEPAGAPIRLLAHTGTDQPLVDGQCRVLDEAGQPLPGLFGIGLAAGYVPRGALGGEPSFRGQANGLWLWQHDVGALIVKAVTEPARAGIGQAMVAGAAA